MYYVFSAAQGVAQLIHGIMIVVFGPFLHIWSHFGCCSVMLSSFWTLTVCVPPYSVVEDCIGKVEGLHRKI